MSETEGDTGKSSQRSSVNQQKPSENEGREARISGTGDASNIDIFLRVRPIASGASAYSVDDDGNHIEFTVPRDAASGYINNSREKYDFRFTGIFDMEAKQDVVFERIAHKVVLGALEGFNGTIFAYGQTGSGKTFTITGGAERYVDRGIIPRAISLIFSELSKRSEFTYTVHFSYLEIYNEMGYDLLDPNHETKALEDLPKVVLLEDEENRIHLRNLSAHLANNEEEALNLLFLGDTNRMISATPMNMASSRSHCIFTASIEARRAGEETVRRSKLHLVDLAGSERVSKTNVEGQILKEAKYINLSLHFLEQVIVALQERSQGKPRQHIPYRNSMMTSVLRDSLGGNCRTVMVATVNVATEQLEETISTCRFAQRVAMVSNQVTLNQEVDPMLVIKRLKQEIRELKEEIRLLRGEDQDRGPITESEMEDIRKSISTFLEDRAADASLNVGASMMHIRATFSVFKEMLLERGPPLQSTDDALARRSGPALQAAATAAGKAAPPSTTAAGLAEQVQKLQLQVRQRDNEINILVSMLRKREAAGGGGGSSGIGGAVGAGGGLTALTEARTGQTVLERGADTSTGNVAADAAPHAPAAQVASPEAKRGGPPGSLEAVQHNNASSMTLLADRSKAFEMFRRSYRKNEAIEENKSLLRAKYTEAKALGEQVNKKRERINKMKADMDRRRMERAVREAAAGGSPGALSPDEEEDRIKAEIEEDKAAYKDSFARLRELKSEIEHLQMILEHSRIRLQKDFEEWLGVMALQQQLPQQSASAVQARSTKADFVHSAANTSAQSLDPALPGSSPSSAQPGRQRSDGSAGQQPHVATAAPMKDSTNLTRGGGGGAWPGTPDPVWEPTGGPGPAPAMAWEGSPRRPVVVPSLAGRGVPKARTSAASSVNSPTMPGGGAGSQLGQEGGGGGAIMGEKRGATTGHKNQVERGSQPQPRMAWTAAPSVASESPQQGPMEGRMKEQGPMEGRMKEQGPMEGRMTLPSEATAWPSVNSVMQRRGTAGLSPQSHFSTWASSSSSSGSPSTRSLASHSSFQGSLVGPPTASPVGSVRSSSSVGNLPVSSAASVSGFQDLAANTSSTVAVAEASRRTGSLSSGSPSMASGNSLGGLGAKTNYTKGSGMDPHPKSNARLNIYADGGATRHGGHESGQSAKGVFGPSARGGRDYEGGGALDQGEAQRGGTMDWHSSANGPVPDRTLRVPVMHEVHGQRPLILTGRDHVGTSVHDTQVGEEVAAFYKAREEILERHGKR